MNPTLPPNMPLIGGNPLQPASQISPGPAHPTVGSTHSTPGSSFSVISNHTGSVSQMNGSHVNGGIMNVHMNGSEPSLTDITLEQAMEKVQELAKENANLRGMR